MNLSSLQNHYDLIEVDNGYQFTTSDNVDYFLTFISYPVLAEYLSTKVYMFNIDRVYRNLSAIKKGQDDIKVRNTVLYVWDLFFQQHEDALITICDIVDGKQYARKRLFDSWFHKFNNNRLCKLETDCLIDEKSTFVSLFYSNNHFEKEQLRRAFEELMGINFYN